MVKASTLKILDSSIFIFAVLFTLTLSNSIFLNQLGYYGALLLLLIKFALTKENPFSKNGLELAIILFIAAELISAVFSENKGQALFFMLKRVLLLPILYFITASAADEKSGKKYFYFYLAGAFASVLIYLYFSYKHLLLNLYNVQQSGPSLFQYPITASEIMSFTVLVFFAFLINEKTTIKYRIFYLIGFLLSSLALFSTYKRTGWIGTAAGIVVILVLKKQWKTLAVGAAALIIIILTQKNVSTVEVYSTTGKNIKHEQTLTSTGRAYSITSDEEDVLVSDFQNGITAVKDSSLVQVYNSPAPVTGLYHWKDNYYTALLYDTRVLLLKKESGRFRYIDETVTPGLTAFAAAGNNCFYVLDIDSGLTIYTYPGNLRKNIRFKEFTGLTKLFFDDSSLAAASNDSLLLAVLNNGLPTNIVKTAIPANNSLVYYHNNEGILSGVGGSSIFYFRNNSVSISRENREIKNLFLAEQKDSTLFLFDSPGKIYAAEYPLNGKLNILFSANLNHTPGSVSLNDNKLYCTYVHESRILSIFDMYNISNYTRIALWRAGWLMFLDHPLWGVGDIDLHELYIEYKRPYDKEIQGHLHNNFMHVLATLGIVGFFAVCYLLFRIFIINKRIYNEFKNVNFYSSYALGVIGSFCSILAAGLTEMNLWDHEILTLILFTTGLNIAFYQIKIKKLKQAKV